ncbi:MAG: autotransporter outer membrane beta-barrel domain-containing protein, partial [Opitutaceae bacterium]|nr:autotransporter outer membrane beta-barrel domain-containing protein [Opitutaceae bacterium]
KIHIDAGGALALAGMDGDYTFAQPLTGAGRLLLANTGTLAFGTAAAAFTGTVTLQNNRLALDTANAAPLARATLELSDNNFTAVATGTQRIGNLALTSGTLAFTLDATGTAAAGIVNTGTLSLGASTVVMIDTGSFNQTLPLLQQDETLDIRLIDATARTGATQLTGAQLIDQHGGQLTAAARRDIAQNGAASGTYNFAVTVSDSGMRLGYDLVALELLAGRTTVLDHETDFLAVGGTAHGGHEMHALVSGSGHLRISATGAIWLNNGNNTHTGETLVTGGTLITGDSGALGATSLLSINATAAADLRATAQTVGALAASGALHFNGGTLAITGTDAAGAPAASTSAGALTGDGALIVQNNTLTIAGANPGLRASTTIAAGALADLKHAASLGSGTLTTGGTLRLDIAPAGSGTLANTLTGTGALIKTNAGTVTLATANPAFAGPAHVEGGLLRLENLAALGDPSGTSTPPAPIAVSPGATLEYARVTGALARTVNGTGTLAVTDSATLTIAHDNPIAHTLIENAAVYLASAQALGADTATVRAGPRAEIHIARDGARLGHVTLDNAKLGFTQSGSGVPSLAQPPPPAFKTATLATLAGNNATLAFNVDFTAASGTYAPGSVADHLTITDGSAGAFTVSVTPLDGDPSADETAIPLITDAGSATAVYQLEGEKITLGLSEFEFANGAAADSTLPLEPGTWYLYSTGLSQAADAIIGTVALLPQDWHTSLDALHQRMGEMRDTFTQSPPSNSSHTSHPPAPAPAAAAGNIWLRARAYRLNAHNSLTGRGVEHYAYGATAGGDKTFATETGVNLLGAFIDMGRVTHDYGGRGTGGGRGGSTGETGAVSAGLYATMLRHDGWHADLVLKADRYKHDFEVSTVNGRPVRGRYNSGAVGASLELGRHLERADGWWLEPGVQAAVARLTGADYRTTPANVAINVKVDAATSAQYRAQVRFGRRLQDTRWMPHAKFGMVKTDTTGGAIRAHERQFDPSALGLDGWRLEFGAGAGYRINNASQMYFDYEYNKARAYERPWSLNLGYRRLW